jgi:O-antigen ligase/Tfp pilus assembly protein PilF
MATARRMRRGGSRTARPDAGTRGLAASKLRLIGVALVCGKVALVPLIFDPSLDLPFAVSKALLSHAFGYLLAGVIAASLVRLGRDALVWSWLHVPVLAFLAVNVAATIFAENRLLALYGTHSRMLGLGTIADWVVLYFGIVLLVRTRREAVVVITSAVVASALVLSYEVIQLAGKDPFQWTTNSADRPFSTLGQATTLGQYLTAVALGIAGIALAAPGLSRRARAGLLTYAAVLLAGTAANGTRSALLGIATGSGVLVVAAVVTQRHRRVLVSGLITVGLAVSALTLIFVPSLIGARTATTIGLLQGKESDEDLISRLEPWGSDRFALYQIALDIVRERPLLGYGPDGFAAGVPSHRPEGAHPTIQQGIPTSGHSWISYVATSSGLLGLAAYLAVVGVGFLLTLLRGLRSVALAGAALVASFLGTGLTTVNEIGTEWLFWAGIAMIAAATASPLQSKNASVEMAPKRMRKRRTVERRFDLRLVGAFACIAGGILLTLTVPGAARASQSARASQDLRLVGKVTAAIEAGLDATGADSSRASYWHQLGLGYVAATRWGDAQVAFDKAIKLAPYDVRFMGDLATTELILARGGDNAARARALELADRTVATDPNNPAAHQTRAVVMQVTGNMHEAARSVERAIELDARSPNARLYITATQIMMAVGRPADAVRIARQGTVILSVTPQSFELRLELARALAATGQRTAALNEIDLALTIRPNDANAQRLRAEVLASSGS